MCAEAQKVVEKVFSYLVECYILNAYILEHHLRPSDLDQKGSKKRDYLSIKIKLEEQLISNFQSQKEWTKALP